MLLLIPQVLSFRFRKNVLLFWASCRGFSCLLFFQLCGSDCIRCNGVEYYKPLRHGHNNSFFVGEGGGYFSCAFVPKLLDFFSGQRIFLLDRGCVLSQFVVTSCDRYCKL